MNEDTCKKCQRKIMWATMPSGKACPFVKVKAYVITSEGKALSVDCGDPTFISHFVDCPAAGSFSKKGHAT